MFKKFFGQFSKDIGIDLGTSNTRIYVKDRGIVINEPSVVAMNNRTEQILAVGKDAQKMVGKTPPHISAIYPLEHGVVSDFEVTEKLLKYFLDRVLREHFALTPRPRVIVGIPMDITEVEKKAVEDAVLSAGAKEVLLVNHILASAVGARLPIHEPGSTMVMNLGGGVTEIAIISLNGIVTSKSLRLAGNEMTGDIILYARNEFNLLIGPIVADEVKKKIGMAMYMPQTQDMKVRGRDLISGLPKEITLSGIQICDALSRSIRVIVEDVKALLELAPPELAVDIYEKGMVLSGGGALLAGFDQVLSEYTKVPVHIESDALTTGIRGMGIIMEDVENMREIFSPSSREDNILR